MQCEMDHKSRCSLSHPTIIWCLGMESVMTRKLIVLGPLPPRRSILFGQLAWPLCLAELSDVTSVQMNALTRLGLSGSIA